MSGHTRKPGGDRDAADRGSRYGDAASSYTGRRRAGADDYDYGYGYSHGDDAKDFGQEDFGQRLSNDRDRRRGVDREAAQRNADRARKSGRRRATVDDAGGPHLFGRLAKAGPIALAMAVGGAVAAFAAPSNGPAAQPIPQATCTLRLPAQPLTAQGLATPFVLASGTDTCHESDSATAAFVQGLVLDPATGHLSVYDPLVVDQGTQPAVAPAAPTLPANAVVALWFGFNGSSLALSGNGVQAGSCVNGAADSLFGQFSYCNAPAFFTAANAAIAQGKLTVPPIGTAADGNPCPTTRDFGIVDQDQSDNVTTTYLALADGRTAQNTHAATKKLAGSSPSVLANGSDNLLLDHFVDPALNCTPFTAPDLANPGFTATSLGLNELQAAADQRAPIANVPVNDPMVLDANGNVSDAKTDLYRAGVDQLPVSQVDGSGTTYCTDMRTIGVTRTKLDRHLTDTTSSPDPGAASDLFSFLAQRLQQSYVNLNCEKLLNEHNPVHLKTDSNGIAVDATFDEVGVVATPSPSAPASASAPAGATASASPTGRPSTTPVTPTPTSTLTSTPSHVPPPVKSSAPPTKPSTPPAHVTTPPPSTSAAAPPPPASTPANPGVTQSDDPSSKDDSNPSPGAVVPAATNSAASQGAPNQPVPTATGKSTTTAAGSGGGTGSGSTGAVSAGSNGSATKPGGGSAAGAQAPAVTSTPISVAGFEHSAATRNPNSALSGPDPMANSGFDIMHSRTFWALGGAVLVLGASLLYRRRPNQRRRGGRRSAS